MTDENGNAIPDGFEKWLQLRLASLWTKISIGVATLGALAAQINEVILPASAAVPYLKEVSLVLTAVAVAAQAFGIIVHFKREKLLAAPDA